MTVSDAKPVFQVMRILKEQTHDMVSRYAAVRVKRCSFGLTALGAA